jgi:hypothetical protein
MGLHLPECLDTFWDIAPCSPYVNLRFGGKYHLLTLYFSILPHCIVQWVLQVMLPSACSFIVYALSLTTVHNNIF